jgi:hypothetical protein
MPNFCPGCGEDLRSGTTKGEVRKTARRAYEPKKKSSRKKDPKLARAMKQAYAKAHKKDGSFRKGWNRSKQLKEAHRLKRKMR